MGKSVILLILSAFSVVCNSFEELEHGGDAKARSYLSSLSLKQVNDRFTPNYSLDLFEVLQREEPAAVILIAQQQDKQ
jgi:hypothetical protein